MFLFRFGVQTRKKLTEIVLLVVLGFTKWTNNSGFCSCGMISLFGRVGYGY